MPTVMQAYRFAVDPTPRQQRALASHCGAARVAYNWGLDLVTTRLAQRHAGEDVEVPWTLPELRREWNRARDQIAPWWPENSKEAYDSGLNGLATALKNYSDSKHGRRKGRQMGFPRRKRRRHARVACRFSKGQRIKVLSDRKHVQLPRIGVLKTHESTRKLARRLEQGTARILAATISRRADRWFISFTCKVQRMIPAGNDRPGVVGVDVGVRHLAVLSTGIVVPNPGPWNARCGSYGGSTGNWLADGRTPGGASRPVDGWPGCMSGRPTSATTHSKSSPPPLPPSTAPWSWNT
jgi:putative transposase